MGLALYQTLFRMCTPSSNTTVVTGPPYSAATFSACEGGDAGSRPP